MKKTSLILKVLLLTIFLDALGIGVAMPLFTPLLLNSNLITNTSIAFNHATLLLNIIFALYPLGMFIGSPVIGIMVDKFSAKPVLLNCVLGNMMGVTICIFGILYSNLLFILCGRLLSGLTAGNIPTAQSVIISLSDTQELKSIRIGYISMFYGLGFTVGPILTTFLPEHISLFSYSIPMIVFAILLGFNFTLLLLSYHGVKNLKVNNFTVSKEKKQSKLSTIKKIKTELILLTCLLLGQFTFFQYLPIGLDKYFNFISRTISILMSYYAIIFSITLVYLFPKFIKKFSLEILIKSSFYTLSMGLLLFSLNSNSHLVWFALLPIPCMLGIGYVAIISMISMKSDQSQQGVVMGISNSIAAFAWAATPLTNTFFIEKIINLPSFVAALIFTVGSLICFSNKKLMNNIVKFTCTGL